MALMKKRLLLWTTAATLAAVSVVIGIFLFPSGWDRVSDRPGQEGSPYRTDALEPGETGAVLEGVRSGKISLPHELARLRSRCTEPENADKCDSEVRMYLEDFDEPDRSELLRLFQAFRSFENEMQAFGASSPELARLGREEKYSLLRKKRREILGAETADLLFGLEEANNDYQKLIHQISSGEFAGMLPDERIRSLEKSRRRIFGPYYETLTERETAHSRLGLELLVRDTDLAAMPAVERDRMVDALRVKYLGEEQAQRIHTAEEKERRKTEAQNSRLEKFLAAEKEIDSQTALGEDERRSRVERARREIFTD